MQLPAPTAADFAEKKARIRRFLSANGYTAAVLGRQENVAWCSFGGVRPAGGTGKRAEMLFVILPDSAFLVQDSAAPAIPPERALAIGFEPVGAGAGSCSLAKRAEELVSDSAVLSDVALPGRQSEPDGGFRMFHFPLTCLEIKRMRWIGGKVDAILWRVACRLEAEEGAADAAALLQAGFSGEGISAEINAKRCDQGMSLSVDVEKWGLHAAATRVVCFKGLQEPFRGQYDRTRKALAAAASMCIPGERFDRISSLQQNILNNPEEVGGALRIDGGFAGYLPEGGYSCGETGAKLAINQAYCWNASINELSCAETVLSTRDGVEIATASGF